MCAKFAQPAEVVAIGSLHQSLSPRLSSPTGPFLSTIGKAIAYAGANRLDSPLGSRKEFDMNGTRVALIALVTTFALNGTSVMAHHGHYGTEPLRAGVRSLMIEDPVVVERVHLE